MGRACRREGRGWGGRPCRGEHRRQQDARVGGRVREWERARGEREPARRRLRARSRGQPAAAATTQSRGGAAGGTAAAADPARRRPRGGGGRSRPRGAPRAERGCRRRRARLAARAAAAAAASRWRRCRRRRWWPVGGVGYAAHAAAGEGGGRGGTRARLHAGLWPPSRRHHASSQPRRVEPVGQTTALAHPPPASHPDASAARRRRGARPEAHPRASAVGGGCVGAKGRQRRRSGGPPRSNRPGHRPPPHRWCPLRSPPVERGRTRVGRSGGKGGGGWSVTTLCRGRRRGRREGGWRAALVAHTPPLSRGRGRTPKPFSWRGGSGCVGTRRRRARRPLGVAGAEERLVWRGVWAGRPGGTGSTGRPPREAAWCNRSFIGSGGGAGKVAGAVARRRRGGLGSGSGAVTDDKRPAGCPPSYTPHAVRRRAKGMTAGAHGGARVCSLAAGRPSICNGRERRQGGGRTVVGRAPCRPREGAAARARPLGRVRCSSADRTGGCQPTWPSGLMGSAD